MLGADTSVQVAPLAAAAAVRPVQPQPEQRVVESPAQSTLQQQHTGAMLTGTPSSVEQLVESARQFADILDSTGNVQVASSVSGFRVGLIDTYA